MISEICANVQERFSDYLDGAVSGQAMAEIASHIEACPVCSREFESALSLQQTLTGLGPVKVPANLGVKLRIAISHESVRRTSSIFSNFSTHWENAIRPMLVQVSAGVAGTIVLVGSILLLLGIVAAPQPVMANDVPLGAVTSPHYLYSAVEPRAIETPYDTTIVVEAAINSRGQVYDYRIVSGPEDPGVQRQVVDQLLTSVFEPASVFGAPVRGRVILTFSGISVRA